MYKVIHYFTDLQDGEHAYSVGDVFPRQGKEVSQDRLNELSGSGNRQHKPLIAKVDEPEETEPTTEESETELATEGEKTEPETAEVEQTYTADALNELSANKIREIAEERGYTIKKRNKAEIVEEFLQQQG